jgi:hypothetical protein
VSGTVLPEYLHRQGQLKVKPQGNNGSCCADCDRSHREPETYSLENQWDFKYSYGPLDYFVARARWGWLFSIGLASTFGGHAEEGHADGDSVAKRGVFGVRETRPIIKITEDRMNALDYHGLDEDGDLLLSGSIHEDGSCSPSLYTDLTADGYLRRLRTDEMQVSPAKSVQSS